MSEEGVKKIQSVIHKVVCCPEKNFSSMMNKQNWKQKLSVWEEHETAQTLYL